MTEISLEGWLFSTETYASYKNYPKLLVLARICGFGVWIDVNKTSIFTNWLCVIIVHTFCERTVKKHFDLGDPVHT